MGGLERGSKRPVPLKIFNNEVNELKLVQNLGNERSLLKNYQNKFFRPTFLMMSAFLSETILIINICNDPLEPT